MFTIYIDADACPVKDEVYKVADRHRLQVVVVANRKIRIPHQFNIRLEVVGGKMDEADLWIVDQLKPNDLVITSDIPLADLALKKNAKVLGPKGKEFNDEMIGEALANREISNFLRESGLPSNQHAPFSPQDRSLFLGKIENVIQKIKREIGASSL
jgi:uncharacterized protein YaiI (UPF0178 family)